MTWSTFWAYAYVLIKPLFVAIIGAVAVWLTSAVVPSVYHYVKSKADAIDNADLRASIDAALEKLEEITISVVDTLEQEVIKKMKASIAAGGTTFTQKDIDAQKEAAINQVLNTATSEVCGLASKDVDVKQFISNKVSQRVLQLRQKEQQISVTSDQMSKDTTKKK